SFGPQEPHFDVNRPKNRLYFLLFFDIISRLSLFEPGLAASLDPHSSLLSTHPSIMAAILNLRLSIHKIKKFKAIF
ncbi:MAG: hypothetical protein PVH53_13750, partial [Desulfobacterales bacterium]